MLKTLIRKYILIIPLVFIFFLICLSLLLINNDLKNLLSINSLIVFLLLLLDAYMIRLLDDYKDYEKDKKLSKDIFNKKTLAIIIIIILIINLIMSIYFKHYLNLSIAILILLINFFNEIPKLIKALYLPLLVMVTFISIELTKNIYCYLFILVSFLISILYSFIKKGHNRNEIL